MCLIRSCGSPHPDARRVVGNECVLEATSFHLCPHLARAKSLPGSQRAIHQCVRERTDPAVGSSSTRCIGLANMALTRPMVTHHLERHVEKRGEGLLFHDRHRRNLRPADFQAAWHAARGTAGRGDLKFHYLRHTGAVLGAQSGATLADLPAMAMIYQHTAADRDRLSADCLSQIALGEQGPTLMRLGRGSRQ